MHITIPVFNYPDQKASTAKAEEEIQETDLEDTDKDECVERVYLETQIQKESEEKTTNPPEYHEKHYEALGVKQIKHALTVDRMFKCADRVFLKLF